MEHLLGGVADKFRGLHLPRVVGDYHMRPPSGRRCSRARIEELARLIERMGSVNLDAMREHAEAEERFTYYTTQKADLEKALADLDARHPADEPRDRAASSRRRSRLVNARFKEIFPRMFRGGRAELRLTNPEDMLETGIDIVAQPPGKKLVIDRADERRREGADGREPHLRHLPDQAFAVLHPRRGRRAAR